MSESKKEPAGSFFVQPHWVAHCDGGAWPHPGSMAIGVVLVSPQGVVGTLSQRLDGTGCSNEAEWRSTVAALKLALSHGARALRLCTDSALVRDQLNLPVPKRCPPALQRWRDEAVILQGEFDQIEVAWVPRHRNGQADALARAALGLPPKPITVPHPRRRKRR